MAACDLKTKQKKRAGGQTDAPYIYPVNRIKNIHLSAFTVCISTVLYSKHCTRIYNVTPFNIGAYNNNNMVHFKTMN